MAGTRMNATPLLSCENLAVHFGGLHAVDGLSFAVHSGSIHGLIGPNGAGKTTVFNAISGYLTPSAGRILHHGENIAGSKPHVIAARGVVRTFQQLALFNEMTVLENVLIGTYLQQRPTLRDALTAGSSGQKAHRQRAEELLEFWGLTARRDALAATLPHGLQRALGIAIAMAAQPQLLLLDEPFTGMNPEETQRMMTLTRRIRDAGITLLLVEHDMRAVTGLCDWITVINFGQLLTEGIADDIIRHPQVVEAYLGRPAESC